MDSSNPNNPPQDTQRRRGKGRQKTGDGRIESETKRQVSFSKRRSGLFKKAHEVGTLCAVETAIITDSPSGKFHSFGNPNVETVARRYLGLTDGPPYVHDPQILAGLNEDLMNLESQLAWEKNHKKESLKMMKEMEDQYGVPPNLDELNYEQLAELLNKALSFKHDSETKQQKPYVQGSNLDAAGGSDYGAPMVSGGYPNYPNQFGIGSSSNEYNGVVFPNNPGEYNPNATFFSANNTNPEFDDSFNPMASNLGLPFEYHPIPDSGSNPMYPFSYGNPSDVGETGGTSAEAEIGRLSSSNGRGRGLN